MTKMLGTRDVSPLKRSEPRTTLRLLVAIPCLNEAATIEQVIARIPRDIAGVSVVDVLVVDDGSTDDTVSRARASGAAVLTHHVNQGVGAAFQTALDYAVEQGYDFLANIDGDGQFNPEDIADLIAPLLAGHADMATASRFKNPEFVPAMPRARLVGNRLMSWLISRLVRIRYYDVSCGFRCYSRDAMLRLNLHGAFTYTQETFIECAVKKVRIVEVPVRVRYHDDRQSRVAGSLSRYAISTAKIIFRSYRDYYPLRFFFGLAAVVGFPRVVLGIVFWVHFLVTGKFSGYLFAGFGSGFFVLLSLAFAILGIVTDMLVRVRTNQERLLYLLKRNQLS